MGEKGPAVSPEALERLAEYAVSLVPIGAPDGALIGLGSGRAASAFVRALGERVRHGLRVRGVPTSEATAALARVTGIPLVELEGTPLDLTVDGADEVDPDLNLIKGYGGAFVRERIVAAASRRQVILVTADKLVPRLGTRGRLPVEIVPFARRLCERRLEALGCRPELRGGERASFLTDNGNLILDCGIAPLDDPAGLEREIRRIPGVVDTGLFLGTAETVVAAEDGRIRVLTPQTARR